jgi:hypothetical protein
VSDLRNGMGGRELMEKYTLSESQLHKVLHKLVDAGTIDEMELFMRTSLDDSTITKAFAGIQRPVQELHNLTEVTSRHDLETSSEISITEEVSATSNVFSRMLSKLAGTGS